MALKETHTLNGDVTLFIQIHDTDCEPPEQVKISPLQDMDGRYVFIHRYTEAPVLAKDANDFITVTFERI